MTQEIFGAARALQHRKPPFRASYLRKNLGGSIRPPEPGPAYHEESFWLIDLHNIQGRGDSCLAAIEDWISKALDATPRRSFDGRPTCPFDGQPPAPATTVSPPTAD